MYRRVLLCFSFNGRLFYTHLFVLFVKLMLLKLCRYARSVGGGGG